MNYYFNPSVSNKTSSPYSAYHTVPKAQLLFRFAKRTTECVGYMNEFLYFNILENIK